MSVTALLYPIPHTPPAGRERTGERARLHRASPCRGNGSRGGDRRGPSTKPSPGEQGRAPAAGCCRGRGGDTAGCGERGRKGRLAPQREREDARPTPTARYLFVVPRQDPLHCLGASAPLHGLQHRAQLHARRPPGPAPPAAAAAPPRPDLPPRTPLTCRDATRRDATLPLETARTGRQRLRAIGWRERSHRPFSSPIGRPPGPLPPGNENAARGLHLPACQAPRRAPGSAEF